MIDTDKYEGHTPAPWNVREAGINRIMVYTDDEDFAYEEANRNLVADAALILEAYKRLREENKMLRHGINDAISMGSSGAKTPMADGSIKHYFPLYLLESMVERCPICDENVESGCDPYCESMEGR